MKIISTLYLVYTAFCHVFPGRNQFQKRGQGVSAHLDELQGLEPLEVSEDVHYMESLIVDRCSFLGQVLNGKYLFEREIGKGTQSVVFSATTGNQNFAIKCIIDPYSLATYKELKILEMIEHPNIIKLIESFTERDHLFIVMEMCEVDLLQLIKSKDIEIDVKSMFIDILNAVDYLHSKQISHCDLKPQNILVTNMTNPVVKLTDFGLSTLRK